MALASWRGSSTSGRSKTRTPVRLEPMPRRTFLRGRSAAEKKAAISLASASESRTSPPTTTSGGSVCRAALTSFGLPLLTTTAAASWDAPTLSPTTCLCRPPELGAMTFFCFGARFGSERLRFGDAVAASLFGVGASAFGSLVSVFGAFVSAFADGLRLNEMSFFRNSESPLTVRLLRLGGRGGPREGGHRCAVRRRCARAAPRTLRAGSSR